MLLFEPDWWNAPVLGIRRQFSVLRMLTAVIAVALPLAWLPWRQIAVAVSIGLLIPIFITGLNTLEIVEILAIAFIIGALLTPPV